MSKATPQNVIDEGFRSQQFGTQTDTTFAAYLQAVLDRASHWVSNKIGAVNYAAINVPTVIYLDDCVVQAETYFACSLLWDRRSKFIASSSTISLEGDRTPQTIKQFQQSSTDAMALATYWLQEAERVLGIDVTDDIGGTGISTGVVETGQFAQTDTEALNAQS